MLACDDLRGFVGRLLGWTNERAINDALRSIEVAADHRAHLVLCGEGDLVPIAHALHQRTLGPDRPFVVCDPRRGSTSASVRAPANHESGVAALAAATGGSLCVRRARLPRDFSMVARRLGTADAVQYIVCVDGNEDAHPLLVVPAPIRVPSLTGRASELPRIVDEYVLDAMVGLGARGDCLTEEDRAWLLKRAVSSLSEIEKATRRLVALRTSSTISQAAARLGMAPVSLSRWIERRRLPHGQPWTTAVGPASRVAAATPSDKASMCEDVRLGSPCTPRPATGPLP